MSRDMRFPTMWYVRPAKPQISLRICAVWSEPLLVAWIFYECKATDWAWFGVSKLKRRLHRLVWVYTCKNATLLEITCRGSNSKHKNWWLFACLSTFVVYRSKTMMLKMKVDIHVFSAVENYFYDILSLENLFLLLNQIVSNKQEKIWCKSLQ